MIEILKRIEEEVLKKNNIKYIFNKGTGEGEYDEPDKFVISNSGKCCEISVKYGSSWYISDGLNIRFLTLGYKNNIDSKWYNQSYRYLDTTCNDDQLIKWLDSVISTAWNVRTGSILRGDILSDIKSVWKNMSSKVTGTLAKRSDYSYGMVKSPKIIYHYDDMFDSIFDMEVVEIKLPTIRKNQDIESIIIQSRKDSTKGELDFYINTRVLTSENPPKLIGITEESKLDSIDSLEDVMLGIFKQYLTNSIYPYLSEIDTKTIKEALG